MYTLGIVGRHRGHTKSILCCLGNTKNCHSVGSTLLPFIQQISSVADRSCCFILGIREIVYCLQTALLLLLVFKSSATKR